MNLQTLVSFFLIWSSLLEASVSLVEEQVSSTRWQIGINNSNPFTISVRTVITTGDNTYMIHPEQGAYVEGEAKWSIVEGNSTKQVLVIGPDDLSQSWTWYWQWNWHKGKLFHVPVSDELHVYRLPFNGSYTVSSSFKNWSPFGAPPENWHMAVDWPMPVGTPLLAARGGTVIAVREDSDENGPADATNSIEIEHEDGTMAFYSHLRLNGAAVVEGEIVTEGQLIGSSGNTGFSSEPHLHLHLFYLYLKDGEPSHVQMPMRFFSKDGLAYFPRPGTVDTAINRSAIPDSEDANLQLIGSQVSLSRRVPKGISSSVWRSFDLSSWTRVRSYEGDGSRVTFLEDMSWDQVFYRWEDTAEMFEAFMEP